MHVYNHSEVVLDLSHLEENYSIKFSLRCFDPLVANPSLADLLDFARFSHWDVAEKSVNLDDLTRKDLAAGDREE